MSHLFAPQVRKGVVMKHTKKQRLKSNKILTSFAIILLVFSLVLLLNEYIVKPLNSKRVIEEAIELYRPVNVKDTNIVTDTPSVNMEETKDSEQVIVPSKYDEKGRLTEFTDLLEINSDVKGWIQIPGTNIDYPVLKSSAEDPEYYLTRNLTKETDKMGSIFIDVNSNVEDPTKNLVIHGHNMTSSDNMFHYLLKYNDLAYYRKHPIINFDTIYEKGKWKIISIFKANANITEDFFNYTRSSFTDDADYLDFIYQLRVRSLYNIPVDINEMDSIITLSTCSYELDNYRTVIVARKIRENETETVDVAQAVKNPAILYPANWYLTYGGQSPVITTFQTALKDGQITWYYEINP